ncbi:MAG: hypothetical protein JSS79_17945 [Bacteroidetes bacterium]|nr:hypothetical protein [Bacteroidota bacterium]
MIKSIQKNLDSLSVTVAHISDEEFNSKLEILSGSSVGAHVRHVLEFYIAILQRNNFNIICYDDRERDIRIETDRDFALSTIETIKGQLNNITSDRSMLLKCNFKINSDGGILLESSLFRELAYAFEHSIHHQALIKVGIKTLGLEGILTDEFGIAPSTIRFKSKTPARIHN